MLSLVVVTGLFATGIGCEPQVNDKCLKPGDCGESLLCIDSHCITKESANERCKTHHRFKGGCEKNGACTWKEGQCAPASEADCLQSSGCKADARCTFNGKDGCILTSDEDCKKSESCSKLSRCSFDKETKKCVPGSDAECKNQADCKHAAACSFDKATGKCAPSAADCKSSVLCANLGLCALDKAKSKCVPGSDEDCKLTVDCKGEKKCSYDEATKTCVK